MADKNKNSYKFSKSFYDDAITQDKWWSKLYFKLLWGGVDDNEIVHRVLIWIPDDFKGRLLDVPVGTALAALSLAVVVPDKQGYACKSQDEFEGYNKDVLHNGNGL